MIKNTHRFIAVCSEGNSIIGDRQIWDDSAVQSLEEIIKHFLKTGYLKYTENTLIADENLKPVFIKHNEKLYPKIDKLYLWEAVGNFRKRRKSWGNIINGKL